jgi:hypothetical protein
MEVAIDDEAECICRALFSVCLADLGNEYRPLIPPLRVHAAHVNAHKLSRRHRRCRYTGFSVWSTPGKYAHTAEDRDNLIDDLLSQASVQQ